MYEWQLVLEEKNTKSQGILRIKSGRMQAN